jgi:hypothetical protein
VRQHDPTQITRAAQRTNRDGLRGHTPILLKRTFQ